MVPPLRITPFGRSRGFSEWLHEDTFRRWHCSHKKGVGHHQMRQTRKIQIDEDACIKNWTDKLLTKREYHILYVVCVCVCVCVCVYACEWISSHPLRVAGFLACTPWRTKHSEFPCKTYQCTQCGWQWMNSQSVCFSWSVSLFRIRWQSLNSWCCHGEKAWLICVWYLTPQPCLPKAARCFRNVPHSPWVWRPPSQDHGRAQCDQPENYSDQTQYSSCFQTAVCDARDAPSVSQSHCSLEAC